MADHSQIYSIPCLTDPDERKNYVSALWHVSLECQPPQTQTPVLNIDLTLTKPEESAHTGSGFFKVLGVRKHHSQPKSTPPRPPPIDINTEISWKTALFFNALLRVMLAGPPYYPCRNITRYAHTMLINGADDGPGITACSHVMKPAVVDKVMTGLIERRRLFLRERVKAEGGVGLVYEWRRRPPLELDLSEMERARKRQAVDALEESLDRWLELEAGKEWGLVGERGRTKWRIESRWIGGDVSDEDDAASSFSFEVVGET